MPQTRLQQLDVLRGIAILLVLGRHWVVPPDEAGRLEPLAMALNNIGWAGVDLFFVLSGFLIGGLLFKEIKERGTLDVRRFLLRRAWKIWPAYVAFILFLLFQTVRHGESVGRTFVQYLPNIVHLQNYLGTPRGHTWTLAVEEHFYLALPILLLVLLRLRGRDSSRGVHVIPWIALGLSTTCLIMRLCFDRTQSFDAIRSRATHLRIDSLFFGVFLAYLHHFRPAVLQAIARHKAVLLVTGLALILPMAYLGLERAFTVTIGFTMLYLGFGCILVALVYTTPGCGRLGRLLACRPARALAAVGVYSYAIYLWHIDLAYLPVIGKVRPFFDHAAPEIRWLAVMGVYPIVAIFAGVICAHLIERPGLALRERLFPARPVKPLHRPTSAVSEATSLATDSIADATLTTG